MLPRVCCYIRVPSQHRYARCPHLLGSPGELRRHAAAGVPRHPAVLPPSAADATEAHTLPATPARPLRASCQTSPPFVGTPHITRRLSQTSVSAWSPASVRFYSHARHAQLQQKAARKLPVLFVCSE